ncbi:MAG: hypothetical protein WEC12_03785 [Balneolaceae bacterium]
MGQQQLLLVILVTIIVGIATVVAINTFGTAADQANIDAVNNDIATLASAAQGHYMRPEMLGGGGRTFTALTFEGLAFPSTGITADMLTAQNENGRYTIANPTASAFTITADPSSCEAYVPGDVDGDGLLTGGTPCAAANQITANVTQNSFELSPDVEPEP